MQLKGILINQSNSTIEREITYDDTRIDNMYYKVDGKHIIPIAYIFPIENKEKLEILLAELRNAKKQYDDITSRIYYQEFRKLRS